MAIVERERTTLNPPKAAPTGWPIPLANAEIEVPPVIAGDVIRPVSMILMIVLNRFFFFYLPPGFLYFINKKCFNFSEFF